MRGFEQDFQFARALGLQMVERGDGRCEMAIDIVRDRHFNPQGAAHGGVAYSLADTAMGGALTSLLPDDQWCATLEIKFNYHVRITEGLLTCEAEVLHRGKRVANIDARLYQEGRLVGSANGNFAIIPAAGQRQA
ncbi:PaaI family thioesterase [Sphingopyxis lindanitolerans]|uniref:PaaI family thioesterase n=1 Tax=Sphingopyxis lindanitolerans TaxID=2054227 RepID=A0A2S8B3V7_9SPHN|nr:PaaI family thioesterase [Sphingopyxis lindanitolerans]PQM27084.1 PaaI family thioesterase [Sphingopyxis lindanitolerans]